MELCEQHRGLELADILKHGSITHVRDSPFPSLSSSAGQVQKVAVFIRGRNKRTINPPSFVGVLDLMFLGVHFLKLQKGGTTLNSQGFVKISKKTNEGAL